MVMGILVSYLVLSFIAALLVMSACVMAARADQPPVLGPKSATGLRSNAKAALAPMRQLPPAAANRVERPALAPVSNSISATA